MSAGHARENAAKVHRILTAREGSAVLYRTINAGPSGQRAQHAVARVEYTYEGSFELAVWCPPRTSCQCDEPAGYLARSWDGKLEWALWDLEEHGYRLAGHANSPAVGADILINGEHAALGRHDSVRISRGKFIRHVPLPVRADERTGGAA
jgi:hypothetical protein